MEPKELTPFVCRPGKHCVVIHMIRCVYVGPPNCGLRDFVKRMVDDNAQYIREGSTLRKI